MDYWRSSRGSFVFLNNSKSFAFLWGEGRICVLGNSFGSVCWRKLQPSPCDKSDSLAALAYDPISGELLEYYSTVHYSSSCRYFTRERLAMTSRLVFVMCFEMLFTSLGIGEGCASFYHYSPIANNDPLRFKEKVWGSRVRQNSHWSRKEERQRDTNVCAADSALPVCVSVIER